MLQTKISTIAVLLITITLLYLVPFPPLLAKPHAATTTSSTSKTKNHHVPSYLIIGAGKAGTSSLYEYLSHHSKFLPAKKKQVHYFKYYYKKGMTWYLSQFPKTHLHTGEAAPGYLPYPYVAERIYNVSFIPSPLTLPRTNPHLLASFCSLQDLGDDINIIMIARDPIERAFSSYMYNYRSQPLKANEIISFNDLISAELAILDSCLSPGGSAEQRASSSPYMGNVIDKPRFNVIEGCYEDKQDEQWRQIIEQNPSVAHSVDSPLSYLFQAFVGRGLYSYQLEWWLGAFNNVFVVCSQELKNDSKDAMTKLGNWMGVEGGSKEWEDVVQLGAYNVGGATKSYVYDEKVSWDAFDKISEEKGGTLAQLKMAMDPDVLKRFEQLAQDELKHLNELQKRFAFGGGKCEW